MGDTLGNIVGDPQAPSEDQLDRRQILRRQNRLALIEATLASVAEKGIAETSVSEIVARAGLSRGMIHLHFGGKDALLEAAIAHSSDDYYDRLDQVLAQTGDRPQDRIEAIVRGDLGDSILNQRNVAIWYAFRGEARNRAAIAAHSDTRDARLRTMVMVAFREIAAAEDAADPQTVARDATNGMLALLEGMWADYLLHPDQFDREEAARVAFRFLGALFPRHFCLQGAL